MRHRAPLTHHRRSFGIALAMMAVLTACGGADTSDSGAPGGATTSAPSGGDATGDDVEITPSEPTGVLRMAPSTLAQTFDPAQVQSAQQFYLQPLYDTLLRLGDDNEVLPGIAEAWEYDGTTATLSLREGPTFVDGAPIDAEAVKANLDRFLAANGPRAVNIATLADVAVIDPQTVELTFTAPAPSLLIELAQTAGMMMDPAAFDDPDLATSPAGTSGPYVLDPSTSAGGDRYVYALNEEYWDPTQQQVEQIEILPIPDEAARTNALRSGEVNLTQLGFAQIAEFEAAGYNLFSNPGSLWYAMIFDREGTIQPALADPKVRQALAMAIDREAVVGGVFFGYGTPTAQPYLEGELGYSEKLEGAMAYDPERARELLAEAGYPDGFEIAVPTIPPVKSFAEALAGFWGDIGVELRVEQVPAGTMAEAGRSGQYPVFMSPTALSDVSDWYQRFWAPEGAYNRAFGVIDAALDELGAKGASEVEPDARAPIYAEIFEVAVGEGFFIPVARVDQVAAGASDVTDVAWHVNEFFPNPLSASVG